MPAYRDDDGNVVEEETIRTQRTADSAAEQSGPENVRSSYDERTRLIRQRSGRRDIEDDDEVKTRIVGSRPRSRQSPDVRATERPDPMDDPVVGWLVVIQGPGKGSALPLGSGTNTIGRSGAARVSVNFGDDQISRSVHAIVTYDPRNRAWYIERGHGKNLAYVDDQPVLQPMPLEPQTHMQLGSTTLRFVPFCSKNFDWQDTSEDE